MTEQALAELIKDLELSWDEDLCPSSCFCHESVAPLLAEVRRLQRIILAYGLPLQVAEARAELGPFFVGLQSVKYRADSAAYRNGHILRHWRPQDDGTVLGGCFRCQTACRLVGDKQQGYYVTGPVLTTQCPQAQGDADSPDTRYAYDFSEPS